MDPITLAAILGGIQFLTGVAGGKSAKKSMKWTPSPTEPIRASLLDELSRTVTQPGDMDSTYVAQAGLLRKSLIQNAKSRDAILRRGGATSESVIANNANLGDALQSGLLNLMAGDASRKANKMNNLQQVMAGIDAQVNAKRAWDMQRASMGLGGINAAMNGLSTVIPSLLTPRTIPTTPTAPTTP